MDPKESGKKVKNDPPVAETDPLAHYVTTGEKNCGDQGNSGFTESTAWKRKFDELADGAENAHTDAKKVRKIKNRCNVCCKKLPPTAIVCRCGDMFCGIHIYSDRHGCSFDYKAYGAEQIRKNNPRVTAEKIQKI